MVDVKLLTYLEKEILPLYDYLDEAHNRSHIENVVRFAMELAKKFKDEIKESMVITAAVFHDLGNLDNRKDHHLISAQMVKEDEELPKWFTTEEINEIALACEEHRASIGVSSGKLLSKIIADADRSDSIDITRMIERSYFYTRSKHMHDMNHEQIVNEVYNHLHEKFGYGGYANFNLEETKELLNEPLAFSQAVLNDKDLFVNTLNMFILGRELVNPNVVETEFEEK